MTPFLAPGEFVRHPDGPDQGSGQVQSVIDDLVMVSFEEAGKVVINARNVERQPVLDSA